MMIKISYNFRNECYIYFTCSSLNKTYSFDISVGRIRYYQSANITTNKDIFILHRIEYQIARGNSIFEWEKESILSIYLMKWNVLQSAVYKRLKLVQPLNQFHWTNLLEQTFLPECFAHYIFGNPIPENFSFTIIFVIV